MLKVESTLSFCLASTINPAARGTPMHPRDVGEANQSTKLGKRSRNDYDGSEFLSTFPAAIKPRRDEPTEAQGQRDLLKTKCFNCGRMGNISAKCELPYQEAGKV